ncbi:hypothetical protein Lfu02_75830 [Longispora fulva]|nr:hypothetical protein Lfu02_75830 [Longispora fulva]
MTARQIAFVPTWLWAQSSSWDAKSATATVAGVSVTATARPRDLRVSTGDGAAVVCQGAGTPWTPSLAPTAASPSCGHTFTRAGSYTLTATVTWDVSWVGAGASGTVPALTTSTSVTVVVVEAQALIN